MDIVGRHVSQLTGYAPPFRPHSVVTTTSIARHSRICAVSQVEAGATALVVCGTTGESPTLSVAEHATLITIAVGVARGG